MGLYYLQSRYYNPTIGRFLNADALVSTGQGVLGNNMFAYCLNNPVNAVDPYGEDAIWLQDLDFGGILGHTALLFQDANGYWYYFSWGSGTAGWGSKQNVSDKLRAVGSYTSVAELLEYINRSGWYSKGRTYDAYIYFSGDFSACVAYAKSVKGNYNALWNNCMQVAIKVLLQGDFGKYDFEYKSFLNKIRWNPTPNIGYARMLNFINSIRIYESTPWYFRWNATSPAEAVMIY